MPAPKKKNHRAKRSAPSTTASTAHHRRRNSTHAAPNATAAPLQDKDASGDILFTDVLSGAWDDATPPPPPRASKRVLLPQPESPKLHKVLAQAGIGSRLEMEALIAQGRVQVNGQAAHVGQRIQYGDSIKIDGRPVRVRIAPPLPRVLAYHKPVGELVTHDDPQHRPTVFRTLPRLPHGKWQAVGRLDLNTEGLLLITSSGELANQLMHPRFGLQREYAVRVLGALTEDEKQRLLDGVELEDGIARFGSVDAGGGEGVNQWYKVTISEGRNREVRRMFEAVGHAVSRLIRIRYGMLSLTRGLRRGTWTELSERDVKALMQAAGLHESKGLAHVRRQEQHQRPQRGSPDRALRKAPRPSRPPAPASTRHMRSGYTHTASGTEHTRLARSPDTPRSASKRRGQAEFSTAHSESRSGTRTTTQHMQHHHTEPRWTDDTARHTRRPPRNSARPQSHHTQRGKRPKS